MKKIIYFSFIILIHACNSGNNPEKSLKPAPIKELNETKKNDTLKTNLHSNKTPKSKLVKLNDSKVPVPNGYKEITRESLENNLELLDNSDFVDEAGVERSYELLENGIRSVIGFYKDGGVAYVSETTYDNISIGNDQIRQGITPYDEGVEVFELNEDSIVLSHIAKHKVLPLVYSLDEFKLNDSVDFIFKYYQNPENYLVCLYLINKLKDNCLPIKEWNLEEGPIFHDIPEINQIYFSPRGDFSIEFSQYSIGVDMVDYFERFNNEIYDFNVKDFSEFKFNIDVSKFGFTLNKNHLNYFDKLFKDEPEKLKLLKALISEPENNELKRDLINLYK